MPICLSVKGCHGFLGNSVTKGKPDTGATAKT